MSREGAVVWLTGRPASGKTTVARELVAALRIGERATLWLDSDALRPVLTPTPTYSDDERDFFYGCIAHCAELAARGGCLAVVSATAPRRLYRDKVRAAVRRFVEVHVTAPAAELTRRDPKGLYAAAKSGEIAHLPGVGAAYEVPLAPELTIDTLATRPVDAVREILRLLDGGERLSS